MKNMTGWLLTITLLIVSQVLISCNQVSLDEANTTGAPVEQSSGEVTVEPDESQVSQSTSKLVTEDEPLASGANKQVEAQTAEITEDVTSSSEAVQTKPTDGQVKYETRAIWARLESDHRRMVRQDIDDLVAQVDQAHLNVILFKVYTKGTTFFEPSQTRFPNSAERLTNQSKFEDATYPDALSYLLAIRDERRADDDPTNDFEVHAWFDVILAGDRSSNGFPQKDRTKPFMLNALFPEFKLKYGAAYLRNDERYARHDTGVVHQPRFRAYMVDLIAGLVEDYDVDGVHLDRIRANGICFNNEPLDYPGTEYDFPGCQKDYETWTEATYGQKYTLWDDTDGHNRVEDEGSGRVAAWQERAVGMLVKDIHDELKAVKPEIVISVASVNNDPAPEARKQSNEGQVAWEWLDKGWIDAAFLTAYVEKPEAVVNKIKIFRAAMQNEQPRSRIFPGLLIYDLDTKEERSYLLVEQVLAAMSEDSQLEPPVKGVALFRVKFFGQKAMNLLAQGPFKEPALPYWGEAEPVSETIQSP